MNDARKIVWFPKPFKTWRGSSLPDVQIAYETWGRLSPRKDNVILILTGLSPGAHAASSAEDPTPGWWEGMVGPEQPIDTDRFYVVCVNSLGSCHGSTGPASPDPRTGRRYGLSFPVLTIEDIAIAARQALCLMGIHQVHAVIGPSLGGMSAIAYALLFPDEVGSLISISAAARSSPLAIAIRSLQREAIRADPAWRGGDYDPESPPRDGLRLARKLGLISYRSAEEWLARFGRERVEIRGEDSGLFDPEFEIESYLEHHAEKFVGSFDANCYLYLSRSMDIFDVAEHGGTLEAGLAWIRAERTLVLGVETDFLFPLWQQREIIDVLRKQGRQAELVVLPSVQGHDSFLVDLERFAPAIGRFLAEG